MSDEKASTVCLAAALADVSTREHAAALLARRLGVTSVLALVPDPEVGLLLPAPGWPSTIPYLSRLRAALGKIRVADVGWVGHVDLDGAVQPLCVLRDESGVMLAMLGGECLEHELAEVALVFPLIATTLRAELAQRIAEGNAAAAREASRQSHELARALDATRAQLEASVRESVRLAHEAERARQRMLLLDRITRELVGRIDDVDSALARVAEAVVPSLADCCVVYVPDDGAIRVAALAHRDAAVREELRRMLDACPLDPSSSSGISSVLRTGASEHTATIAEDMLSAEDRDDPHLRQLKCSAATSHLAVALRGHHGPLGVLGLTMTSRREFAEDDRALAEEIANRAALVIEQQRLLEEARRARLDAEQASRAKDEFLAMLGHELRNPLAPISTALALMKMRDDSAFREERAVIERQIRHVVELVDDLLDVSRITRGKVELRHEPLSVREVIAKAAEMALPLIEDRRHRLSVTVEGDPIVRGDSRRLAQVVSNLLNNAAKYTPEGGLLTLEATRAADTVVVRVRDDGSGIDPELLPHVFDLFTQAPQTMERARGGLGIGLAVVKRLVELHGGSVSANSDGLGKGSEFVIRLPATNASVVPAPVASHRRPTAAVSKRVLVVDDNEDAAVLLVELLRALGHDAEMAHDGPSALRLLDRFTPDVGLLDIGLPVMDGFELARLVRARFSGIFLVAITGYGQAADKAATQAAGFDAHLVKPVDLDQVARLLARVDGESVVGT